MDIVRAHVERVEVVGLDEAYLDLDGLYSPRAAMRRLVAEIRAATQLTCSVGIGPNKLVAKVASDAEKPAGFVVLTPRSRRARASPPRHPALCRASARRPPRAWHELGLTTLAALAARAASRRSSSASGPTSARAAAAGHASNTTAWCRPRARWSRSRASGRSTATSSDPAGCERRSRAMAGELCASLAGARAQRAHDRHQGPPRRLHDGHSRAHPARADHPMPSS